MPYSTRIAYSVVGSAFLTALGWGALGSEAIAQVAECSPPEAGEYLILAIAAKEKEQEAVISLLPLGSQVSVCNYLGETVVRVGGYQEIDEANTWAQSIAAQTGLGAFVTRPPQVTAEAPMAPTPPTVETPEAAESTGRLPPRPSTSRSALPLPNVQVIPAQQVGSRPRSTESASVPEEEVEEVDEVRSAIKPEENGDRQAYLPDLNLPRQLTDLPDYNVVPTINPPAKPPYPVTPVYNPPPPVATTYTALPELTQPVYPPSVAAIQPPVPVSYDPQPLDEGYAVLVDYFNQPEVAVQLQQLVGADVGLASYGQRPYLLVRYTKSEDQAHSALEDLSDRGFLTMVVDSRQVMLLSPVVAPF